MENKTVTGQAPVHTEAFLKKRKFYLVIPMLILPFLTMAFWALGGGKDAGKIAAKIPDRGIDMALPSAQFRDAKPKDKMDIYQASGRDTSVTKDGVSKKFIQAMGFDPKAVSKKDSDEVKMKSPVSENTADQQTAKIEAKLAQINRQMSEPQTTVYRGSPAPDPEVKRLNRMMKTMHSSNGEDPEMKQLNNILTKIQAIQNPGSVKPYTRKQADAKPFRAIPAVIDGKQKIKDGGAVKLKLTDTVTIKKQRLPKGQEVYGVAQITNQRLLLTIQNIRFEKQIIPVSLTVFSLDGMPGIPAPEAELGGAASTGADNAIQSMQILTVDQSIGAQAAAGGVNAAKGLFSKKVKKIKVKLKDQYPLLLKINP